MIIISVITAVSCSSKKKYADIRGFISEVAANQDEFLANVDKSANAEELISGIDNFGNKLIMLSEKSMEIKKRYPDVEKWVNDPPADLRPDLDRLNDTESKFQEIFLKEKIKILMKDKKVQSAFIELNNKMERVKFFR